MGVIFVSNQQGKGHVEYLDKHVHTFVCFGKY